MFAATARRIYANHPPRRRFVRSLKQHAGVVCEENQQKNTWLRREKRAHVALRLVCSSHRLDTRKYFENSPSPPTEDSRNTIAMREFRALISSCKHLQIHPGGCWVETLHPPQDVAPAVHHPKPVPVVNRYGHVQPRDTSNSTPDNSSSTQAAIHRGPNRSGQHSRRRTSSTQKPPTTQTNKACMQLHNSFSQKAFKIK